MAREASGTAWQPDAASMAACIRSPATGADGPWQSRPGLRLAGRAARRRQGLRLGHADGHGPARVRQRRRLQFRAMLSPDPLMGKRGYPLLLASGETADGVEPLVDRQHPHDFFMELSASYSQARPKGSVFLYAGLPGEPAFGPPAFMHRQSISASPEAPITHHWLDSTHITFGVVTAGLVVDQCQDRGVALQRPRARPAPLEHRDRAARIRPRCACRGTRLRTLSLQGSWAHLEDARAARARRRPEALVGERDLYQADDRRLVVDDPRLGPQDHRGRELRCRSRSKAR